MVAKGPDAEAAAGALCPNAIEHYRQTAWRPCAAVAPPGSGLYPTAPRGVPVHWQPEPIFRIEVSTDMVNWTPLGTCRAGLNQGPTFNSLIQAQAARLPRFYRGRRAVAGRKIHAGSP